MVVTCSSCNMLGGNMHLCNVHSGNVQQSTCIACNVRLGCMRHLHGTASRWARVRIAVQSSCTVATLQPASTDLAKKRRHCTRCAATQGSNVQPAAVLYRGNYLGAKADLLRVLGKGDITHAWNPERASNQIQWKQLHTRTFCKGGAFRSKLNSGHTGQDLRSCGNLGGA